MCVNSGLYRQNVKFLLIWGIINFWKLSVGNYPLFYRFINFAQN